MLQLFRLNDPYRLLLVFALMGAVRLVTWFTGAPLTLHELHWMLLGERLSEGSVLYHDFWVTVGPIPAGGYMLLHSLFGKSQAAYWWVAFLLTCVQAGLFNQMWLSRKAYNENSYVPGLLYGLFASLFYDFYTLSPLLIGVTFVLLALFRLFSHLQERAKRDESILLMGMHLGLATLCFLPLGLLIIPLLASLGLYSSTVRRRYALVMYGATLPLVMAFVYYYIRGAHREYLYYFLLSPFRVASEMYIGWTDLGLLLAVPTLFLIVSFLAVSRFPRYINFQSRLQQIMLFMLIFCALIWWFGSHRAPFHFFIFVPSLAFFVSHYLLIIRKRRTAELVFLLLWVPLLFVNLNSVFGWVPALRVDTQAMTVQPTPYDASVAGKRVWVVGEAPSVYREAVGVATPFYNWHVAQRVLLATDYYDHVTLIHEVVMKELPEVIVDVEGIMPQLFEQMPRLAAHYRPGSQEGIYMLRQAQEASTAQPLP